MTFGDLIPGDWFYQIGIASSTGSSFAMLKLMQSVVGVGDLRLGRREIYNACSLASGALVTIEDNDPVVRVGPTAQIKAEAVTASAST